MKKYLPKLFILGLLLTLTAAHAFAQDVYDYTGRNATWNDYRNWYKNGVAQTTSGTYPGLVATDIVYVGVNITSIGGGNSTYNPMSPITGPGVTNYMPSISGGVSYTIASLTYGNNLQPVGTVTTGTVVYKGVTYTNHPTGITGARADMALTIATNSKLTVTGAFTQQHSTSGGPANSGGVILNGGGGIIVEAIRTTISGGGTLTCGSIMAGDGHVPANGYVVNTTHMIFGSATAGLIVKVNNDLTVFTRCVSVDDSSTSAAAPTRTSNLSLDIISGSFTVNGTVKIVNSNYRGYITNFEDYQAAALFDMQSASATTAFAPVLYLGGSTPISLAPIPQYANNKVDFYVANGTFPYPTVNYSGGDQTVLTYNPAAANYTLERYINNTGNVNNDGTVYANLSFSGSGTKTLGATTFNILGNFTLAPGFETVDMTVNNSVLNVAGDYATASNTTLNNGTGAVTLSGNFTNVGTSNFGSALLTFNSAAAATLSTTNPQLFTNVLFAGGGTKTMTTNRFNIAPRGLLTMSTTATILNSGGFLTLKSDNTGSANVYKITAGSIGGVVNVERYLSASRGYRFLSSPVDTTTATNGGTTYSLSYLQRSAYLTGTTATGFDVVHNPTIYLYREDVLPTYSSFLTSNFRGVNTFNTHPVYGCDLESGSYTIPAGNGYLFFFRGNRADTTAAVETTTSWVASAATLTASGTLNQGPINVNYWYTGSTTLNVSSADPTVKGWYLMGNPYPSAIDWSTLGTGITGTNVLNAMYTLNETNHNYGVYLNGATQNGGSNLIASGQGFFILIDPNKPSGTISFNEGAKTTSQLAGGSLFMGKPVQATVLQYLRIKMAKDTINTDEMIVRFNSGTSANYVKNEDAPYKAGQGLVSLSSLSTDGQKLAINTLPFPKTAQAIALNVGAATDGAYTLNLSEIKSIPQLFSVWLMDNFTKDSVDMRLHPVYSFNITKSDTNTYNSRRFTLFVRQNPAYACKLLKFNAAKEPKGVELVWTAQYEENYTNYVVQRSVNGGKTWDVVGSLTSSSQGTYSLVDKNPLNGQNLYRLQQQDLTDNISYSNVVPVNFTSDAFAKNKINVYPNPATSLINLSVPDDSNASNYNIKIMNSSGSVVKQVVSSQNGWQGNVSSLLTGTYIIQVVNNKDQSLVGQAKFVKL